MGIVYGPKWPFYSCCDYIELFGTGFMQVLYLGRAPRTKVTLPDFHEKCRVTRHSRVFRGLTGSQRTPGFWGVTVSTTPLGPYKFPISTSLVFTSMKHKINDLNMTCGKI